MKCWASRLCELGEIFFSEMRQIEVKKKSYEGGEPEQSTAYTCHIAKTERRMREEKKQEQEKIIQYKFD